MIEYQLKEEFTTGAKTFGPMCWVSSHEPEGDRTGGSGHDHLAVVV